MALEFAAKPRPVKLGHFEVGQNQVGKWFLGRLGESILTIDGSRDLVTLVFEKG